MIYKLFEFPPNIMRGLTRQETNFDVIYDLELISSINMESMC